MAGFSGVSAIPAIYRLWLRKSLLSRENVGQVASEIAQQVKEPVTKSGDLTLIPATHTL